MVLGEAHPVFEEILPTTPVTVQGTEAQWVVVHSGPGTGRPAIPGVPFAGGRNDISDKASYIPTDWVYSYVLDMNELGEAIDMDEIGMFEEQYPQAALTDCIEALLGQFVQGDGPQGTSKMTSLNGDVFYDPDVNSSGTYRQTGLLQFLAPGSQTSTTFGLARQGAANGVLRHANGYGITTGHASGDFMEKLLATFMHCTRGAMSTKVGAPSIGLTDSASWVRMWSHKQSRVVPVTFQGDTVGKEAVNPARMGLELIPGFKAYWEPLLDPGVGSPFNGGSGRSGVLYGLNPKTLQLIVRSRYTKMVKGTKVAKGLFETDEYMRKPGTNDIMATTHFRGGIITKALWSHFVMEGTSNT
jgi:hypothetical protein